MSFNVGTAEAVLRMKDEYSKAFDDFAAKLGKGQKIAKEVARDTDKLESSYRRLAGSLDPVAAKTHRYQDAVEILNKSLKAGIINQSQYNSQLAKAQLQFHQAGQSASSLGASIRGELIGGFTRFFAVTALVSGGISAIASVTRQLITANIEAETSERKVSAAIRLHGDSIGITSQEINEYATQLSRLTGIDDELIAETLASGLAFNRLGRDILPKVTEAALDMSAATGDSLPAAMEKAAKYVNQPLKALTLLAREGYAVSASQSDLIKKLSAAGEIEQAQIEILKILQSQYGGTAAEIRDSMGGALTALSTTWENFLERVGQDNMGPLRKALESLIDLLEFATDNVSNFEIGFHQSKVALNAFLSSALSGFADLIDLISKAGPLLGVAGLAVKSLNNRVEISKRARAGAVAAEEEAKESAIALSKALTGLGAQHKKTGSLALEQTAAERDLADKLSKQKAEVDALTESWKESLRFQEELLALYSQGPGLDLTTRLQEEKRINDEHKYRVDLLRLQAKFGKEIGKQLADEAKILRELEDEVKLELKISTKLAPIDLTANINSQFQSSMAELLRTLDPMAEIAEENARAFDEQRQANLDWLESFANDWKESFRSNRDIAEEQMRAVKAAVKEGFFSAAEGEKALAQIRQDYILSQGSAWASLFSTLSNLFGGFASRAISSIQQMISTVQQLNSIGNQIGGSAGAAISSAGPFLAIAGAIYGAQRESIARQRQVRYTSEATLGYGSQDTEVFGRQGRAIANQLRDSLSNIMSILRETLSILPEITIQAREDGKRFRLYVANQFVGTFNTLEEAIDAAVIAAAQHIGSSLSDTFRQVLERTTAQTADELAEDLDFARWYDELGIGQFGVRIRDLLFQFQEATEDADRFGLGLERVSQWFRETMGDIEAELLGVDLSVSKALKELVGYRQATDEVAEAERRLIQDRMGAIQEQIDLALRLQEARERGQTGGGAGGGGLGGEPGGRGSGGGLGGTGLPGGGSGGVRPPTKEITAATLEIERLRAELARLGEDLGNVTSSLSDTEISMAVFDQLYTYLEGSGKYAAEAHKYALLKLEIEFAAIKQQLIALGKWEEFALMFNDAYVAAQREAGKPTRGRGSSDRDSVRDFISNRKFELSLTGATDYQRAQAEIIRQYDELFRQAGKDKQLRQRLIALKEQELQQLRREEVARVRQEFQDFISPLSEFEQIRKNASELIKDINSSPIGSPKKAQMIGQILGEVDRQIERLSKQKAVDLFGNLLSDLEQYGATESQMAQVRHAMLILEHALKVENYRKELAILRAQGNLAPEVMKALEEAFEFVSNVDPAKLGLPDVGVRFKGYEDDLNNAVSNISESLNRLAEEFQSAKDDIREFLQSTQRGGVGLISPISGFTAAQEQYREVMSRADRGELSGFQEARQASENYIEALKAYSPALAAVELPNIQAQLSQLLSSTTVRDENLVYSERFAANQAITNSTLVEGFNDLSSLNSQSVGVQKEMLSSLSEISKSQADLNSRLARLESGATGLKR